MAMSSAATTARRRPEDHPDSVLPDDDTVRDEESTPPDHTVNESVEDAKREESPAADQTRKRGAR